MVFERLTIILITTTFKYSLWPKFSEKKLFTQIKNDRVLNIIVTTPKKVAFPNCWFDFHELCK